jgi:hypothetical protein
MSNVTTFSLGGPRVSPPTKPLSAATSPAERLRLIRRDRPPATAMTCSARMTIGKKPFSHGRKKC